MQPIFFVTDCPKLFKTFTAAKTHAKRRAKESFLKYAGIKIAYAGDDLAGIVKGNPPHAPMVGYWHAHTSLSNRWIFKDCR